MEKVGINVSGIAGIVMVLDANDAIHGRDPTTRLGYRILKICEEAGEASEAFIGMIGQNPLKGICRSSDDVASEVCDVIITAIVALASAEPDEWPAILTRELHNTIVKYANVKAVERCQNRPN